MKTITIGFSKPINKFLPLYSYAIRWAYKTEYSHVFVKFKSESLGRDIVYESVGVEVRFVGTTQWGLHAKVLKEYQITVTDEQYTKIMQFCIDNAGVSYGIWQSAGVYLAKLLKLKRNIFSRGTDHEICSEIVARILQIADIPIEKNVDIVAPKDIEDALLTNICR